MLDGYSRWAGPRNSICAQKHVGTDNFISARACVQTIRPWQPSSMSAMCVCERVCVCECEKNPVSCSSSPCTSADAVISFAMAVVASGATSQRFKWPSRPPLSTQHFPFPLATHGENPRRRQPCKRLQRRNGPCAWIWNGAAASKAARGPSHRSVHSTCCPRLRKVAQRKEHH